jgi:4-hydroxybenzoate polyprenyltransferase
MSHVNGSPSRANRLSLRQISPELIAAALPFSLIASFAAIAGWPRGWLIAWIVVWAAISGLLAAFVQSLRKPLGAWSHWLLGFALGLAPLGVWFSARGRLQLAPVLLGAAILFWTAGFDIIATSINTAEDREAGVFTLPARWGTKQALVASSGAHLISFWLLAVFGMVSDLSWLYLAGVILLVPLLYLLHRSLRPDKPHPMRLPAFLIADALSLLLLCFTAVDVLYVGRHMWI